MKKLPLLLLSAVLLTAGCRKPETITTMTSDIPPVTTEGSVVTEENVLRDFADVLVNPNYRDIQANALVLQQAAASLSAAPTNANLAAAQNAWRQTRAPWENCEAYLFGPVEDQSYDPTMDTWPLDRTQLDSLMASSNSLTPADIHALPDALKGFHATEYVLFGVGGQQRPATITPRQMTYLVSLTQSIADITTALRNSWDTTQPNNYTAEVKRAGNGSTTFLSKKAAIQAIVAAMARICEEVGTGKMQEPLGQNGQADSTLDESSFSHNSTTDFANNIKGIKNAYFCTYNGVTGHSLHELVAAKNRSLDNQITNAIYDAAGSFNTINSNYEIAIYTQRPQIMAIQAKLATLQALLQDDLENWVIQNIQN
ncbi:MAG: hypothetical protein JSS76_07695 [Bacteroidetes bacterium]|nr:hypothetical protein [Bacteroidota bacterium]